MKNKKNYLLGGLFIAVVCMAVGYSALAQRLTVSGTASITGTWDVEITSITKKTSTGTATESTTPSFTATSATFGVDLKAPGDSITYDIVVKNKGNLNALLQTLTLSPAQPATSGIKYTVTGVTEGTTTLAATTGTNTVTVKVEWVSTDTTVPTTKTVPFTATLNYVQA